MRLNIENMLVLSEPSEKPIVDTVVQDLKMNHKVTRRGDNSLG